MDNSPDQARLIVMKTMFCSQVLPHFGNIRMLQVIEEEDLHKGTSRQVTVHGNLQMADQLEAAGGCEQRSHLEGDQVHHGQRIQRSAMNMWRLLKTILCKIR